MNAVFLDPREDLVERVAALLHAPGADPARSLVLFPGKRPAHFLYAVLARRAGGAIFPPEALSLDAFVDLRCARAGVAPPIDPLDAVALLFDVHRALPAGVRPGGAAFASLDAFLPLGERVYAELEEIRLAGCDPARVAGAAAAFALPELAALPELYRRFYAAVEAADRSTRAMRRGAAATDRAVLATGGYDRVIAAGFFPVTSNEIELLRGALDHRDAAFVAHRGPGLRDRLAPLGLDPGAYAEADGGAVRVYSARGTHAQLYGTAALFRDAIARGEAPDERTAVVLPQAATLFPFLRHVAPLLDAGGVNVSLGYPAARTPVFGFLDAIFLACAGANAAGIPLAPYLRFAAHPYVKNVRFRGRGDVTRVLFNALRDRLRTAGAGRRVDLDALERDPVALSNAAHRANGIEPGVTEEKLAAHLRTIHDETLRPFLAARTAGEAAAAAARAIAFAAERSSAPLHPYFEPFARRVVDALDAVGRSRLAAHAFPDPERSAAFLRGVLRNVTHPFPGTPIRGVQVLGTLEVRNLRFDRVVVLDANDDMLPGETSPGTMLPIALRERLGLPLPRDTEEEKAYHFEMLRASARELHLFASGQDGSSPSRYIEREIWRKERRAGRADRAAHVAVLSPAVDVVDLPPVAIGKDAHTAAFLRGKPLDPSALDAYLACGRRFYFRTVLGLREAPVGADDIDAAAVGSVVHVALRDLLAPCTGRRMAPEDLAGERVDAAVAGACREAFADGGGVAALVAREVRAQLRGFVERWERPRAAAGAVVVHALERRIACDFRGHAIAGRVDRIDLVGGRVAVFDYKTGTVAVPIRFDRLDPADRGTWNDAVHSVQLTVYELLAAHETGEPVERIDVRYLRLGDTALRTGDGPPEAIEVPLYPDTASPAEHRARAADFLEALLDEIRDPSVPFAPPADLAAACRRCPFTTICGTRWLAESP